MRIAIFTDSFWPQINGVTTSILNMVGELSKQGHHFLIFAPKPKKFPSDPPKMKNVEIIWLPAGPLPTYTDYLIAYLFPPSAKRAFWDFHADVVHIHTPFFVCQKGIKYGHQQHIPVIGTFHTLVSEFLEYVPIPKLTHNPVMRQLTWAFTKHVYGKCDVITTPTPILAGELEGHGFHHVNVLTNGIDYDLFSKTKAKKPKNKTNLVYFGRVSFEKRIDIALEAFFLLQKKHANMEFHVIGSGPAEESLKELSHELGISKKVHFYGAKRGKALAQLVKQNHILVAPSPMETQGLYILEGMAAGLPVVGANSRAIPVAIGKNERGLLFEPGNAEDCAEKIEKLLKDPKLMETFSSAGKKYAKRFSKKAIAKEWLRLYKQAQSGHL